MKGQGLFKVVLTLLERGGAIHCYISLQGGHHFPNKTLPQPSLFTHILHLIYSRLPTLRDQVVVPYVSIHKLTVMKSFSFSFSFVDFWRKRLASVY